MKRKITKRSSGPRAYDIRKELSQEQLAAFGAVALAWNDVEAMIDVLMCVVSGLHKAHPAVPGRSICSMRESCAGEQRRAGGDIGWLGRDR
jgi:hypothetical protein